MSDVLFEAIPLLSNGLLCSFLARNDGKTQINAQKHRSW